MFVYSYIRRNDIHCFDINITRRRCYSKGYSEQLALHLSLRLKKIGLILRFLSLLIYSVILSLDFSGPLINLISKFLANSLNFIFLSITSSYSGFSYSYC